MVGTDCQNRHKLKKYCKITKKKQKTEKSSQVFGQENQHVHIVWFEKGRLAVTILPATLKRRSEEELVPQIHTYLRASLAKRGFQRKTKTSYRRAGKGEAEISRGLLVGVMIL